MDFTLTPEQQLLKRLCRELVQREIIPCADGWNRDRRFPVEMWRRLAALDLCGLLVPREYGGTEVGAVGYVAAMEEIGQGDQSLAAAWNAHLTIASLPILYYGTEGQKQRWLVPLARGEVIGAFGLTEPNAGSDAAGIETTAVQENGGWVINGSKTFISNPGTEVSYGVLVLATTGRDANGKKQHAVLIVPRGTPGYEIGRNLDKMGWHAMDTRELAFRDCRVPADHLLGEQPSIGLRAFLSALDVGRISVAALSLGLAQACLTAALDYARQRHQFGQPISKFQAIQFKLADMATQVELSRLITYKAAWLHDERQPYKTEAAMAKLYASESAMRCANQAVQIHGGNGYMEEFVVSRYFRDAKVLEIGEGTSEVQRLVIARQLGC
ncbi:MAG: acyl-CoA dehydrogenase family protein [Chloroflexi bacterium]|nr:acyl-CoA dehydrogenase family protein [Chloroflexota bacterium]